MKTKVQLSFMMFVEWFIWGAWFVPLWLWLSKSGFTAGEIGWSYACTAIAAILSYPGRLADGPFLRRPESAGRADVRWRDSDVFRSTANPVQHLLPAAAGLLLTYMPTIALTNSIAFANVDDVEADFPRIRVMGTIGWIASGRRAASCRR